MFETPPVGGVAPEAGLDGGGGVGALPGAWMGVWVPLLEV